MTCAATCARLCHLAGGELEQIQFLLGHASVQTTEHYLGCKQKLRHAVNALRSSARNRRFENVEVADLLYAAGGPWPVRVAGRYTSGLGESFRFRRSVRADIRGHFDRGVPEKLSRQLQVRRTLRVR